MTDPSATTAVAEADASAIRAALADGISLVIPAFNEAQALGPVISGFRALFDHIACRFEILVVDDGSTDKTAEIASDRGATVIRHERNRGYGAALKTGIRRCHYGLVAMADADGQHDAQQLEDLLARLGDADVAIGARSAASHVPLVRRPGKLILRRVANWVTGSAIPDLNSGLRVMRRDVILDHMHLAPDGFSFSTTMTIAFLHAGMLIRWVPITTPSRVGRASSVSVVRDGLKTLLLIVRIVVLFAPLRIFLPVSGLLFFVGMVSSIYGLLTELNIADTDVILLLSGLMIFFFGILADQLAAIRRELRQ